jgi:hypothetical protein
VSSATAPSCIAPDGTTRPESRSFAEYWPATDDPAVVSIFRTEDFSAFMEIEVTWGDIFDITTFPAVSVEDGLKVGADVLGRRQF